MPRAEVHQCECPHCQQKTPHPDQDLHRQMNLRLHRPDEQQRRWYVAVESSRVGVSGDRLLAQITGLDEKTILRGRQELAGELEARPEQRVLCWLLGMSVHKIGSLIVLNWHGCLPFRLQ